MNAFAPYSIPIQGLKIGIHHFQFLIDDSFFALYANIDGFNFKDALIPYEERPEIDRWIISKLNALVEEYEQLMNDYDVTKAARAVSSYTIDQLSNWYVRRSRRRFWKSEMNKEKLEKIKHLLSYGDIKALDVNSFILTKTGAEKIINEYIKVSRVELPVKPEIAEELIEEMAEEVADTMASLDADIDYIGVIEDWKRYFTNKLKNV